MNDMIFSNENNSEEDDFWVKHGVAFSKPEKTKE